MSIREAWKKGRIKISSPENPVLVEHVSLDFTTGEYRGLPKAWERLLGAVRATGRKPRLDEEETRRIRSNEKEIKRFFVGGGVHGSAKEGPIVDMPAFSPNEFSEDETAPSDPIDPDFFKDEASPSITNKEIPAIVIEHSSEDEAAPNRWDKIRRIAAERAARQGGQSQVMRTDVGETSGKETIESRVARIKARVAELTGNVNEQPPQQHQFRVPLQPTSQPPISTSIELEPREEVRQKESHPPLPIVNISTSPSQALGATASSGIEWLPGAYGLTPGHRDYQEINAHLFPFVDSLGHGSLGVVEEVRVSLEFPSFVRKRVQIPFSRRNQYLKIIRQEAQVLQDISHCHIIKILGTYAEIPENRSGRQFYSLLMAPVGERDLKTFLDIVGDESTTQIQDWVQDGRIWLLNWFRCLSSALAYLHGQGIRHQDIKPSNIIHRQGEIYFTDFSSASQFQIGQTTSTENPARTTTMYAAPEVIANEDTLNRHGRGTDVFALGAVFTEMRAVLLGSSIEQYHNTLARTLPSDPDGTSNLSPIPRQTFLYCRKLEQISAFFADDEFYRTCIAPMLKVDRESRPDAQSVASTIRGHGGWAYRECPCDVQNSSNVAHDTGSDRVSQREAFEELWKVDRKAALGQELAPVPLSNLKVREPGRRLARVRQSNIAIYN